MANNYETWGVDLEYFDDANATWGRNVVLSPTINSGSFFYDNLPITLQKGVLDSNGNVDQDRLKNLYRNKANEIIDGIIRSRKVLSISYEVFPLVQEFTQDYLRYAVVRAIDMVLRNTFAETTTGNSMSVSGLSISDNLTNWVLSSSSQGTSAWNAIMLSKIHLYEPDGNDGLTYDGKQINISFKSGQRLQATEINTDNDEALLTRGAIAPLINDAVNKGTRDWISTDDITNITTNYDTFIKSELNQAEYTTGETVIISYTGTDIKYANQTEEYTYQGSRYEKTSFHIDNIDGMATLQTNIDETNAKIGEETTDRISGDANLQTNIDANKVLIDENKSSSDANKVLIDAIPQERATDIDNAKKEIRGSDTSTKTLAQVEIEQKTQDDRLTAIEGGTKGDLATAFQIWEVEPNQGIPAVTTPLNTPDAKTSTFDLSNIQDKEGQTITYIEGQKVNIQWSVEITKNGNVELITDGDDLVIGKPKKVIFGYTYNTSDGGTLLRGDVYATLGTNGTLTFTRDDGDKGDWTKQRVWLVEKSILVSVANVITNDKIAEYDKSTVVDVKIKQLEDGKVKDNTDNITANSNNINAKQDISDSSLNTTDKTITGAINELNGHKWDKREKDGIRSLGEISHNDSKITLDATDGDTKIELENVENGVLGIAKIAHNGTNPYLAWGTNGYSENVDLTNLKDIDKTMVLPKSMKIIVDDGVLPNQELWTEEQNTDIAIFDRTLADGNYMVKKDGLSLTYIPLTTREIEYEYEDGTKETIKHEVI